MLVLELGMWMLALCSEIFGSPKKTRGDNRLYQKAQYPLIGEHTLSDPYYDLKYTLNPKPYIP